MKILQNDIFGNQHSSKEEKPQKLSPSQKEFPNITLQSGQNESKAASDSMLIHRVLQRKLIYSHLNNSAQKTAFLKIIKNELEIKSGKLNAADATRDSLLEFFVRQKLN